MGWVRIQAGAQCQRAGDAVDVYVYVCHDVGNCKIDIRSGSCTCDAKERSTAQFSHIGWQEGRQLARAGTHARGRINAGVH